MEPKLSVSVKTVEQDDLIYKINEEKKTACVIGHNGFINKIIIPRSIKYLKNEYVIISILNEDPEFFWYRINNIQFAPDSKIQFIDSFAFYHSTIQEITIPTSLINLKTGWCDDIRYLNQINVIPGNPRYSVYKKKFLIGKSSINQDNFDSLIFCFRNITNVVIPGFIEKIEPYSFSQCKQLQYVDISIDSNLKIIDEYAFYKSSIERIYIPRHLTCIKKVAFSDCSKLKQVEIHVKSELKAIEESAFYNSSIEYFLFPCHLTYIGQSAFSFSSIKSIVLKSHIQNIKENAFYQCALEIIEIDEDFTIESLSKNFFNKSKALIMIPSNLRDRFKASCIKKKKCKWVIIDSF